MDLLRQEKFQAALEALQGLPPGSESDRDAQLLRAALLTNCGRMEEAEEACLRILSSDDMVAGAHYLLALCREHAGDRKIAAEHDRTAAYLDSGFAMPAFHLGLMARRSGDKEAARRHFERALSLLAREDPARILLFGGGFRREALSRLCLDELRACGGPS
jgi:chemotaxis protein methyltransferase CheR